MDYATALLNQETDINRCPPGGETTLNALAVLLERPAISLSDDCEPFAGRKVARIIEAQCIGCTLCIDPCPVGAILGASKQMHSVLIEDCNGCELCIHMCPVDCIEMVEPSFTTNGERWPEFEDKEVSRWRNLAIRHRKRLSSKNSRNLSATGTDEIRHEIRSAVNRERTRRWRQSKRSKRVSKSYGKDE